MKYIGKQIDTKSIATQDNLSGFASSEDLAALESYAMGLEQSKADQSSLEHQAARIDTLEGIVTGGVTGGSIVHFTPYYSEGKKIADISIDGEGQSVYIPDMTASEIEVALGYAPISEAWITENYYNVDEMHDVLLNYLYVENGIHVGNLSIQGSLSAHSFGVRDSIEVGQGNSFSGDQGGFNVTTESGDLNLCSNRYINFRIGDNEIAYVEDIGFHVVNDFTVDGNSVFGGKITFGEKSANCIELVDGNLEIKSYNDLIISSGNDMLYVNEGLTAGYIVCSSFESQGFSFGFGNSQFLYMEQSYAQFETNLVINGDVVVNGNIRAAGTVASGGKEQEGDSALADLEERVARLESLIS